MTVRRYDAGTLRKPERLSNGFLKADAILTRVGVFKYLNADGSTRSELRLPEEVFQADALSSFGLMPLTDDHPPVAVNADNAKQYQRGSVSESVRQDGDFVVGTLMVTDAALVRSLESGRKREVSCGYSCDLDHTPGVWKGERYDAIQRNIRGNHVAVVTKGRAGPEVRVRLDGQDAVMLTNDEEDIVTVKYRIDGVEYEVSESAAQALAKAEKSHADALASVQTSAEKEKARADAAEDALKKEQAARKDAEDPVKLRERITARVALEHTARGVLGAEIKLDELDDAGVRKAVVLHVHPDLKARIDSLSADYVLARYDLALEAHAKAGEKQDKQAKALSGGRSDGKPVEEIRKDAAEAREKFVKEQREAWKQPLAAGSKAP